MIFLGVIAGIFLAEVGICSYVNSNWLQGRRKKILGGRISLHNCHNEAGLLGVFHKDKKLGECLSVFVLSGIIWEFFHALFKKGQPLVKLGLSFIAGGGLGNCYERLAKGYVTDYISVEDGRPKAKRLVFNLADVWIAVGSLLFVIGRLAGLVHKKR
ncbi:MAG: signal peptidase II [Blautia sp.]|jgi:signal peptidase II